MREEYRVKLIAWVNDNPIFQQSMMMTIPKVNNKEELVKVAESKVPEGWILKELIILNYRIVL